MRRRALLRWPLGGLALWAAAACGGKAVKTQRVPSPVAMLRTSWSTDPWTLGSYSFIPAGANPGDRRALREPVAGRIFFAGEAMAIEDPATVHGAIASGRETAERVLTAAKPGELVVVIGAGVAGLMAAQALREGGAEVEVVEARDRIGGRVATVQPAGWPFPLELGASWVQNYRASDLASRLRAADVDTVRV
ncbi:MAG: FAD-dependent oxidoreductase [Dehalococcoidia bacterium]